MRRFDFELYQLIDGRGFLCLTPWGAFFGRTVPLVREIVGRAAAAAGEPLIWPPDLPGGLTAV